MNLNLLCTRFTSRLVLALGALTVVLATARPVHAQTPTTGRNRSLIGPQGAASTATPAPAATAKAKTPEVPDGQATVIRPILQTRPADTERGLSGIEYGSNFASEKPDEQATHIIVGRSIFVDTKHRLARVYITNPEILDSYTASPNQVVLTAKKVGSATMILWDESGESKSYLVSSDLNVEMLKDSMKQAFPTETIKVQSSENRVVISGTVSSVSTAENAVKMAAVYSKDVSSSLVVNTARVKQVRLEVKIVEVDRAKLNQFGFNFFSYGHNALATTTSGQFPSTQTVTPATGTSPTVVTTQNPLNFSLYSSRLNIGATLQDLETMQVLQILAEPNIVAMSGEKANFLAGGEFPFPVVQGSSTGGTSISIQFRPYGVKLEFTPVVNPDGTIDLTVSPEVSALDYTNAVSIAGYTIPAISTRRAQTDVVLKTGQTFAISGLLDKRTTDQYSKTPGIAGVPVLGQLFKSKNVNHTDSELVVIVTPTIIDPLAIEEPAPIIPQHVVPFVDRQKFDKELPSGAGVNAKK